MPVSLDDVRGIARLAQLAIDDEALASLQHDMNAILSLVDKLNQADTANVLPMAHSVGDQASQRLREDAVTESDQSAQAMAVAPLSEADLYLVPAAIDDKRDQSE